MRLIEQAPGWRLVPGVNSGMLWRSSDRLSLSKEVEEQ